MKILRCFAVLALFLAAAPALAQQVQNHAVPIGKGVGVTGFGAAVPGTSGRPLISNGPAADPSFGTIGNSGFAAGPANTVKGTVDGVSTTDMPLPSCTSASQAWKYTSGVGINCTSVFNTTGYDTPINFGMSSSASAGALTINITQRDGTAPTSGSPVLVPFRSLTLATGTSAFSTISSALSLAVPSGATLGTSNTVPFRIWVFLGANAGTPEIAVATCSNTTTVFPCAGWEYTLKTTTTISAGATSGGVLYTTTGVTLDAVRIVGFCDFSAGLVTAGTWASACTTLQAFGPGIKKPGDTVQKVALSSTTASSTTSATFVALSPALTQSFTPTSAANLVKVTLSGTWSCTGGSCGISALQLARGSTLIGNSVGIIPGVAISGLPLYMTVLDAPQSTSTVSYGYQGKNASGNTLSAPPGGSGVTFEIEEIMGFDVREPANDNLNPGVFSATG